MNYRKETEMNQSRSTRCSASVYQIWLALSLLFGCIILTSTVEAAKNPWAQDDYYPAQIRELHRVYFEEIGLSFEEVMALDLYQRSYGLGCDRFENGRSNSFAFFYIKRSDGEVYRLESSKWKATKKPWNVTAQRIDEIPPDALGSCVKFLKPSSSDREKNRRGIMQGSFCSKQKVTVYMDSEGQFKCIWKRYRRDWLDEEDLKYSTTFVGQYPEHFIEEYFDNWAHLKPKDSTDDITESASAQKNAASVEERLRKLIQLRESSTISESEYEAQRKWIISEI
jgi:hypothetical protein